MVTVFSRRMFLDEIIPDLDLRAVNQEPESLDGLVDGHSLITSAEFNRRHAIGMAAAGLGAAAAGILLPSEAEAQRPRELVSSSARLRRTTGRLNKYDLSIIYDRHLRRSHWFFKNDQLVEVPYNNERRDRSRTNYFLDPGEVKRQYAVLRPFAYLFLLRFSEQFNAATGIRSEMNSLTRSYERQRGMGGNATQPEYSSHCRGCGMDFAYKDMTSPQKRWMRDSLAQIQRVRIDGKPIADIVEEVGVSQNFHVTVFPKYQEYVQLLLSRIDSAFKENTFFRRYFERVTGGTMYPAGR